MSFRFYANAISQASKQVASAIFIVGLMLIGFLIGLGPVILRLILEGPFGLTIPGSDFIPVVEIAVPFFLALGVVRHAAKGEASLPLG